MPSFREAELHFLWRWCQICVLGSVSAMNLSCLLRKACRVKVHCMWMYWFSGWSALAVWALKLVKVWHAVFLDSPIAQFDSQGVQVWGSYQRNLLLTKPSLNRTWLRASIGPRQLCNMTKKGKHHNDSCLLLRLLFGQHVPEVFHCSLD